MKIIRITLKDGGNSKVIVFRGEKQKVSRTISSETEKISAGNRKEVLHK